MHCIQNDYFPRLKTCFVENTGTTISNCNISDISDAATGADVGAEVSSHHCQTWLLDAGDSRIDEGQGGDLSILVNRAGRPQENKGKPP